jgi:plastocyanin
VLTLASKVLLATAGVATVGMLAYAAFTGDLLGVVLLLGVAGLSTFAGVKLAGTADRPALAPVLAGNAQEAPSDLRLGAAVEDGPAALPGGGLWPALLGLGIVLVVAAFVLGPAAAFGGLGLAAAAAVGWTARASAERTGRAPDLMPLGLPVVGLAAIASVMFFMSRILLAVPELASTYIALAVAVLILGAASVVAVRPALSTRALTGLVVAFAVAMTGGGVLAAAAGERKIEAHGAGHDGEATKEGEEGHEEGVQAEGAQAEGAEQGAEAGEGRDPRGQMGAHTGEAETAGAAVKIAATGLAFDTSELDLRGPEIRLDLDNQDAGIPHNVAITRDEAGAEKLFSGPQVTGPAQTTYSFPAPPPGQYFFHCEVHPNMKGTV